VSNHDYPHDIMLNEDGVWWCYTENVVSDECSDEDRCAAECCCNQRPSDAEEDE
jgi:hypothetical protein